jgi:mitochondrial fission protein ELM1
MPFQSQMNSSGIASTLDPLVWVVTGYRAGERGQILALAEALGWRYEIKHLSYTSIDWLPGLLRLKSLIGINRSLSSNLAPPWPDLVISAGMRNEPVCRWIRMQSGNRTKLVQVGRPWVQIEEIDLIVTTPQYRLPERDNRSNPRVVQRKMSRFKLKREIHRQWPQPSKPFQEAIVLLN